MGTTERGVHHLAHGLRWGTSSSREVARQLGAPGERKDAQKLGGAAPGFGFRTYHIDLHHLFISFLESTPPLVLPVLLVAL